MSNNLKRVVTVVSIIFLLTAIIMPTEKVSAMHSSETYTLKLHNEVLSQSSNNLEQKLRIRRTDGNEPWSKEVTLKKDVYSIVLPEGEYEIEEIKGPRGYLPMESKIRFSVPFLNPEGGVLSELKIEIKLEESLKKILITKVEKGTEKGLQGAEFEIFKLQDGEYKTIKKGITTDKQGRILIDNVSWGRYLIKETKAPEGYLLNPREYEVDVNDSDATTFEVKVENEKEPPEVPITPPTTPDPDGEIPKYPGNETPPPPPPPILGEREEPGPKHKEKEEEEKETPKEESSDKEDDKEPGDDSSTKPPGAKDTETNKIGEEKSTGKDKDKPKTSDQINYPLFGGLGLVLIAIYFISKANKDPNNKLKK